MSEKENPERKGRGVAHVTVDEDGAGQRIDNFLIAHLKTVPRTRVYRMLRKGEVRVNKGRVKPTHRLTVGDSVRIPPVYEEASNSPKAPRRVTDLLSQSVLYEDRDLLVINKPGGVAVHGGSGVSHGVVEALREIRPEWSEVALAHRLDRETSGVLVLAKRRAALRRLHADFREDRVSKVYQALVVGYWPHGNRVIDLPLKVSERRGGERHVIVAPDGKPSITRVTVTDGRKAASLLTVSPETGRTHQIRVHLAHLGYPIAGDDRYGDADTNRELSRRGLPRLFLHAQSIGFDDGVGGEQLFTAPLPPDLSKVLPRMLAGN
ncbi:MAG: RluA family pseudouridine synthase [Pseudomonadota bacterium]